MLKKYSALLLCLFQISVFYASYDSELPENIRALQENWQRSIFEKIIAGQDKKRIKGLLKSFNTEVSCGIQKIFEACKAAGVFVPAQQANPQLFALCNTIKQDLGITDEIHFYVGKDLSVFELIPEQLFFACGAYVPAIPNVIFLNAHVFDDLKEHRPTKIHMIAHELGHYLQHHQDSKSYQSNSKGLQDMFLVSVDKIRENHKKMEIGAEANACGYFDCTDCLKLCAQDYGHRSSREQEQGYYGSSDIELFVQRAELDGQFCPAHTDQRVLNASIMFDCQDCIQHILFYSDEDICNSFHYSRQFLQEKLEQAKIAGKRCATHAQQVAHMNFMVSNGDFLRKILHDRHVDDEQIVLKKYFSSLSTASQKCERYMIEDFLPQKDRSSYQKPYLESKLDSGSRLDK